jgi:hypothetical protein
MATFYHVARVDISQHQEFNLRSIDSFPGDITLLPIWTREDFINTLKHYYADGISEHGARYLYNPFYPIKDPAHNDYYPVTPMIENIFELIRKLKFPEQRSRFQSIFACLTLEDAKNIIVKTFNGMGAIFEVECDEYVLKDMNLLFLGNSYVGSLIYAEKYWRGDRTDNPFLEVLMSPPVKIKNVITLK